MRDASNIPEGGPEMEKMATKDLTLQRWRPTQSTQVLITETRTTRNPRGWG